MKTKAWGTRRGHEAMEQLHLQNEWLGEELILLRRDLKHILAERERAARALVLRILPDLKNCEEALLKAGAGFLINSRKMLVNEHQLHCAALAEIEADPGFRDAVQGRCSKQMLAAVKEIAELEEQCRAYDFESFQFLLDIRRRKQNETNKLSKFLSFVSMVSQREAIARDEVEARLPQYSADEHIQRYQDLQKVLEEKRHESSPLPDVDGEAEELVRRHALLSAKVEDFPEWELEEMRTRLQGFLTSLPSRAIHTQLQGKFDQEVGKLVALREKEEHLLRLGRFLEGEIADRDHQIFKIRRILNEWEKDPLGPLPHAVEWLTRHPRDQRQDAWKRKNWVRALRHQIASYSQYLKFSRELCHHGTRTATDLFLDSECDMPTPPHEFSTEIFK